MAGLMTAADARSWSFPRAREKEPRSQHLQKALARAGCLGGNLYLECLVGLSPSVKRLYILPIQLEGFCAVLYCLLVLLQDQMTERSDAERPSQKFSHLWILPSRLEAAGE